MTASWATWQGQLINGTFALRRLLGETDHSGVFLTDYPALSLPDAAIKFVPATASADAQLAIWQSLRALPHPNLARVLDSGHYEHDGQAFLYTVTDYAEQSLAEILPHRALTADEVRAMLQPVLDALSFLGANQLVQGQLKPSNVLVIDDQVKLAIDTVRTPGAALPDVVRSSIYDPPESASGLRSPAGDIWALGITIVEALTQQPPGWTDERPAAPSLPAGFPRDFVDVVLRCLRQNPAQRPTPQELKAQLSGESTAPLAVLPEPFTPPPLPDPPPRREPPKPKPAREGPELTASMRADIVRQAVAGAAAPSEARAAPKRTMSALLIGAVIGLVLLWAGSRLFHHQRTPPRPSETNLPTPQSSPTTPPTPPSSPQPAPEQPAGVLHQELPTVGHSSSETIHGHLHVVVRVVVNRSGNVIDDKLEDAGPSKYFARLATTAARQWKFVATDAHATREWLVRFDFSRDGVTADAAAAE